MQFLSIYLIYLYPCQSSKEICARCCKKSTCENHNLSDSLPKPDLFVFMCIMRRSVRQVFCAYQWKGVRVVIYFTCITCDALPPPPLERKNEEVLMWQDVREGRSRKSKGEGTSTTTTTTIIHNPQLPQSGKFQFIPPKSYNEYISPPTLP